MHYVGWHTYGQALKSKFQIQGEWHEYKLYPVFNPNFHDYNALNHWIQYIKPDYVLGIGDIQKNIIFSRDTRNGIAYFPDAILSYLTVDMSPLIAWRNELQKHKHMVVPTKWAEREIAQLGGKVDAVIPHPIDHNIWKFLNDDKRKEIKVQHKLPEDCIIIGGVGNNQDRKKWNIWIKIFAMAKRMIEKEYEKKCIGYLHVPLPRNEPTAFYDIESEIQRYGLQDSVSVFGDQYGGEGASLTHSVKIKQEGMQNVYGLCDILLHTAGAGAWELPISEAQVCGTLAVANDYAGMSESCLPELKVRPREYDTNETGADVALADDIGMLEKIDLCMKDRKRLQQDQRDWVKQYSSEIVAKQWSEYFLKLTKTDYPEEWTKELVRLYNGD